MLGTYNALGASSGSTPGGTVFGNILRGLGGALFGGTVGTGGIPAQTSAQAQNQGFWKQVGAGLAGTIGTIFAGLFSKDANGNIQNPNGILTAGATPYYPTASAQLMSFFFPILIIVGVVAVFRNMFGKRKKSKW